MNGPRTYLHGDPIEGEPARYFCDRCDAAVAATHFEGCILGAVTREGRRYQETHVWRYVQARRAWLRSFVPGDDRRIVDDPGNLFRTGAASEQPLAPLEPYVALPTAAPAASPPEPDEDLPPLLALMRRRRA